MSGDKQYAMLTDLSHITQLIRSKELRPGRAEDGRADDGRAEDALKHRAATLCDIPVCMIGHAEGCKLKTEMLGRWPGKRKCWKASRSGSWGSREDVGAVGCRSKTSSPADPCKPEKPARCNKNENKMSWVAVGPTGLPNSTSPRADHQYDLI